MPVLGALSMHVDNNKNNMHNMPNMPGSPLQQEPRLATEII
jgi:hypothetical protein